MSDLPENVLYVPTFARLVDYVGLFSIDANFAAALREMAASIDMKAHVAAGGEQLRSAAEMISGPGGKSVALIKLTGLLMKSQSSMGGTSTIQVRRDVRNAANDPNVGAILLAIDSPGGSVAGTDDLAKEIKAAGSRKPVWSHIDDLGASAAYWAASQTARITVNSPTALVGSIGTYQVIYDHSGAADKAGVKALVFATGALKGLGTPGSKVTDEQVAHVQALVDSVQRTFDEAVQKGRGLSSEQLAAVRHGGAMTATQAMKLKLVDAIQPLGKTLADLTQAMAGNAGSLRADSENVAPAAKAGAFPMLRRQLPMLKSETLR